MIGLTLAAIGAVLVVVGLFVLFGAVVLAPAGVVLIVAGLFPDWDRVIGRPVKRGKRS